MRNINLVLTAVALLAALGACRRAPADPDALDGALANAVASAEADPALAGALGNQIVVDPARTRTSRAPVEAPAAARPLAAAEGDGKRKCDFPYDLAWARRLPAELPLYPGARLVDAAGSDASGCKRRIVSFTAGAPADAVIAFYREKVTAAGYSAERLTEQGSQVLGGTRGEAAYYISVAPAPGGSAVDIVSNGG